ncbi:hypothetical protein XYCOK13_37150 [Xylanibacillus composti]|uniref:SLH domain-containing protein n=2 Tax=Xylanibacillus composti TaxID=1572762 RepID=A0A8J4H716_9BACL|nr:hypothetical protein XYCOK13_37150 [Xylanibacillus composti]
MKKSLSLLLAIAMVFSMFASVASAADDLTAQQKFDALKAKGIFSGMPDGSAGLDQDMTRAQFARVAGLVMGLDFSNPPATASFSDVQPTHWAFDAVEAVKEAGLMSGYSETVFGDKDNITIEQMARVYVDALGLEVDEEAEFEGASEWAQKYVKAAVDAGLISADADFTANATRAQLVEVTYVVGGKVGVFEPAKVSIVSAKPTGVKEVTVVLDKAVDTEKAKVVLKRVTTTVATTTTWSDDRKTATLELTDAKIMEGDYTVTLEGLNEEDVQNGTATFKAENERVVKLEFTTPSDTIAQSDKVRIDFEALNQYDEPTSINAGNFDVYASTPNTVREPQVKKDGYGKLYVDMDTDDSDSETPVLIPNVSQISVNVINTDSQISVNKTFKLGSKPYVAKVELGDAAYSNGEDYLSKQGDKVVIELIQYDQYGHRISEGSGTLFNASVNVLPYLKELEAELDDDNNDDFLDVIVRLKDGDAKVTGEYTVNVFGGSSATKVINVKATKYAATVELEAPTLAAGDENKYITVTAYDVEGNKLSADDIVQNYESGHLQFGPSGNLTLGARGDVTSAMLATQGSQQAIVKTGEHKGKLHIALVGNKGAANIFVNIIPESANGIMFSKNFPINIQDQRYPVSLRVKDDNAKKAIAGAESKLKVVAIDNYGEEIKGTVNNVQERTRTVSYAVYVERTGSQGTGVTFSQATGGYANLSDVLDKDLKFESASGAGYNDYYEVKISLVKINQDTGRVLDESVSSVTKRMTVINPNNTRLTYSLKTINPMFAAIDNSTYVFDDQIAISKHAKTVELEAKDGSGDKVALPGGYILSLSTGDSSVAEHNSQDKVLGNKAGKTTVRVLHTKAEGGTGTLTQEIEVKSDAVRVAEFNDGKASATMTANGQRAWSLMELKAKDNYGTEYKHDETVTNPDGFTGPVSVFQAYDKFLGVRYSVSEIQFNGTPEAGAGVTVDNNSSSTTFGAITVTGNVAGFTLTADSPTGQSRVTAVSVGF